MNTYVGVLPIGFHIKSLNKGCEVGYVTHTNPRGKIPTWLTNKVSSCLAPKLLRKLHKACLAYPEWKKTNGGHHKKHWLYPELMTTPRVNSIDVRNNHLFIFVDTSGSAPRVNLSFSCLFSVPATQRWRGGLQKFVARKPQ